MGVEEKESAKALFGFSQVPFAIVVDATGKVIGSGDPKSIDLDSLIKSCRVQSENAENKAVAVNHSFSELVLDEDF